VIVRAVAWDDPASVVLRAAQRAEIEQRYGTPDSEPGPAPTASDITSFFVAFEGETPIGCGGLRQLDDEHGEVKRMFVLASRRGSGASVAIIRALEDDARARGWNRLVLETGTRQPDAVRFYEREGFGRIPNFGHYPDPNESLCFGKSLL
jgi:putative acetyltransferase